MQKIRVKNFQAIKEMEIEFDKCLVLIGEQASGKSTISKLIYFYKSIRDTLLSMIYEEPGRQVPLFPFMEFEEALTRQFTQFFGDHRALPIFEIEYAYAEDKIICFSNRNNAASLEVSILPKNSEFAEALSDGVYGVYEAFEEAQKQTALPLQRRSNLQYVARREAMRDIEDYVNLLFDESRTNLFIPAGRNVTNYEPFKLAFYGNLRSYMSRKIAATPMTDFFLIRNFLEHVEFMQQVFKDRELANLIEQAETQAGAQGEQFVGRDVLEFAQKRMNQILKGNYLHDSQGEKLVLDSQNYVYLQNASSGQQEVIRILQDIFLILLEQTDAFRVIEEPEAHLYPMAQKHLVELFAVVLNKTDSQIILTTHSPYILSVLNNLLFARRVVDKNSEVFSEVNEILPEMCWLDPRATNVYFLKDGHCRSIFDDSIGLIDQNSLDEISEELGADFEELYDIYAKVTHG